MYSAERTLCAREVIISAAQPLFSWTRFTAPTHRLDRCDTVSLHICPLLRQMHKKMARLRQMQANTCLFLDTESAVLAT